MFERVSEIGVRGRIGFSTRTNIDMARRRLGQHFLRDRSVARRIVDAAGISVGDVVVEIGPGDGALTGLIVEEAASGWRCSVVLIELDEKYATRIMADRYARAIPTFE